MTTRADLIQAHAAAKTRLEAARSRYEAEMADATARLGHWSPHPAGTDPCPVAEASREATEEYRAASLAEQTALAAIHALAE